jgi:NAD(P)-dependent dehydrogenase (short-subunit alcohol dehydrogenase family)
MLGKRLCDSGEFQGKVAIVTGGGRGIGKAFAYALAARGAAVGVLGRTEASCVQVADELNGMGHRAIGMACDVVDEGQVEAAVAKIAEQFGGVDILINNAGLHAQEYNHRGFGELGIAKSRRLLDVNIMGTVICSLLCQPYMVGRGGGVILNLSSSSADLSAYAYGVSKLAVNGLTISLATELAKNNIRVNGIAPGMIITPESRQEIPPEQLDAFVQDYMTSKQLIQKIADPEEIVNAMLYLCSDWSSFVTGETLRVTGGYPLHS